MTAQISALEFMFFDIADTADLHLPAAQAVQKWKIDPERARRALLIISYGYVLKTYDGAPGDPAEFEVRSLTTGEWYTVTPDNHTCTCPDSTYRRNICKHRIAVYLYAQRIKRTTAKARQAELLTDLGF